MRKPVADLWYGVEHCKGNIIHIRETHINQWAAGDIWLICGLERDLVFDTGTGIFPLEPLISIFSSKPKLAVACCHYYDHAGGMYAFEDRACHSLEAEPLTKPSGKYTALFEDEFYALPHEGFQATDYKQKSAAPTQLLEEGDLIDLGDRTLKVLHIPGRTPGSIALWEESTGYLFGGETVFIDPVGHEFPPEQSIELYEQSLKRLRDLPVKKVFGGHYGAFSAEQLVDLVNQEIGRYRSPIESSPT